MSSICAPNNWSRGSRAAHPLPHHRICESASSGSSDQRQQRISTSDVSRMPSVHKRRNVACYVSTEYKTRTVRVKNIFEINLRCTPYRLVNLDRCSGFLSIVLQNMHLESVRLIISISKLMDSCFPQNLFLESRSLLPPT